MPRLTASSPGGNPGGPVRAAHVVRVRDGDGRTFELSRPPLSAAAARRAARRAAHLLGVIGDPVRWAWCTCEVRRASDRRLVGRVLVPFLRRGQ